MTKTEAQATVKRLRRAGIIATVEKGGWKPNAPEGQYRVVEAGIARGQKAKRIWWSPVL